MAQANTFLDPRTILQRCTKFKTQPEAEAWLSKMINAMMTFVAEDSVCAVFDIDGTILKDRGDDNSSPLCNKMLLGLFNLCRKRGIPIFIITARPDGRDQRKWTVGQLTKCGYAPGSYAELIMMPIAEWKRLDGGADWNFSDYKYKARRRIVQTHNKTIILNAGDQWTDLLRVPPCAKSAEESTAYDAVKRLPNSGIYVASLIDLSWISVKLPH